MDRVVETGVGPEFLLSEANGYRSRDNCVVAASQTLLAGTVLGRVTTGAATVTPGTPVSGSGGTVGNGAVGAWTADALAPEGRYWLVIIEPATDLGMFQIEKPDGTLDGTGIVGTAYNGVINGTLADGSNNWVAGDRIPFDLAYAAGNGQVVKHDPEGVNGSQTVYGILYSAVTTAAGETAAAVAIRRDAEIFADRLVWDDHDAGEKTAALAALAAMGVISHHTPAIPN